MKRLLAISTATLLFFSCSHSAPVTLTEDAETYTLNNGIVAARVSKVTGDLVSLRYGDKEMFATGLTPDQVIEAKCSSNPDNPNWDTPTISGKAHGYWSHDAMGIRGSEPAVPSVTINPSSNGGKRGEVSVKAVSHGRRLGTGPGTNPALGDLAVDIEIRYTLEKGMSGVYTYCIFNHPAEYPLAQFGEARYCAKLAPTFDWMSVDKDVDFHYPKEHNAGDKYVYTANQTENPAFGWSSTTDNVGLFFINPSMEYMSGGPTKIEFLGHRNTSMEAEGCVLNYWRSSHYGGAEANMAEGEDWSKIIGPFLIYANSGEGHEAIYADAKAQAAKEQEKWPYSWVKGVDYPKAEERAEVRGHISIDDPYVSVPYTNFHVGLAAPQYISAREEGAPAVTVTWQRDAKHYQFWTLADGNGTFSIPKVRPGSYTLYAFADGVLGEFAKVDVEVPQGGVLDLGELKWTPIRKGEQAFEIGIPNRNGSEFYGFDQRRDPEITIKYATFFPEDINYTVGESDCSKDWFYIQVPHNTNPEAKSLPFFGVREEGRATPYVINFDLKQKPESACAVIRLALCGTSSRYLEVNVNGKDLGQWALAQTGDGVITRHGSHGIWHEEEFSFDASLLRQGTNRLVITVPEGSLNTGIVYDYLRLEI